MKLLIANGRLIDPAHGVDAHQNLYVLDGVVVAIGPCPDGFAPDRVLDATGLAVIPGLVDVAARLCAADDTTGQPQRSELTAAAAGGVTRLVDVGHADMARQDMPNGVHVHALANLMDQDTEDASWANLAGYSLPDDATANPRRLLRAMQYAKTRNQTLWLRPEEPSLAQDGVAASGAYASRLGLKGIPVQAETIALHTIFELQRVTGARVHLRHLSSAAGVALLRAARREGLPVTSDVSVNNLHLTDNDIGFFDSNYHLRPPLRGQRDRDALQAALREGVIDAISSGHTPVRASGKQVPFAMSSPGATGLELLLSLTLKWARDHRLDLLDALARVTSGPAAILASGAKPSLSCGHLGVAAVADMALVDLDAEWIVGPQTLQSLSSQTPFAGMILPGRLCTTLTGGRPIWENSA